MRKIVLLLVAVMCLALCGTATAGTLELEAVHASCTIPDNLILLTTDNLEMHRELVERTAGSEELLLNDWEARGVLYQAWNQEGDLCVEITCVQDEEADKYFDVDQQGTGERAAYRNAYLKGTNGWKDMGYTVQSAEWKKTTKHGRFLMLKYKRTVDGETYRGYARRTVRNGYSIMVDVKVYGRGLKNADLATLNGIMDTFSFDQVSAKPVEVVNDLVFTDTPPAETNTGRFTVAGTCDPGLRLIGAVMRMSSPDPIVYETLASAKGKFSFDVKLPQDGVWLMAITVMNGETEVGEYVFDTTTYQKTLLPVNFDTELPKDGIRTDKLVISGTTERQTTVQCIVSGGASFNKQIKTNNSGKFSFTVDTSAEGDYEIVVTFAKKGYTTRRYDVMTKHEITEAELIARAKNNFVKPAYTNLVNKLSGYTGKIMRYDLYVTNVTKVDDSWLIFMAMTQTKNAGYKNIVVVTTDEEPNLSVDSMYTMYGTCIGEYRVETEGRDTVYPCFKLITFE